MTDSKGGRNCKWVYLYVYLIFDRERGVELNVNSQIVDNVVRGGKVDSDPQDSTDGNVVGVRKLLAHLKDDKEVDATTLGIIGDKGYDGLLYAIKL